MTTNALPEIVEQIKLATDFQTNKRILREKVLADLHMLYKNGMFKITPEIISFVTIWPQEELFLEDTYQNPIKILKSEFLPKAIQHYQIQMNVWHQQHDELKKIRKI
jgi:hypothetical protein